MNRAERYTTKVSTDAESETKPMLELEPYWLIDTETLQKQAMPHDMTGEEANERNEYMKRQNSRWKWVNARELRQMEETPRGQDA